MAAQSSNLPVMLIVGGALYYLYTHTSMGLPGTANGAPPVDPQTPAPPPAGPSSTAPLPPATPPAKPPVTYGVTQPTPATAPPPADERETISRLAATGNLAAVVKAEAMGIKWNSDQWNYFRGAGGGGDTTTDLFPPENRAYLMGATEYLSRRSAAGLSGVNRGWRR